MTHRLDDDTLEALAAALEDGALEDVAKHLPLAHDDRLYLAYLALPRARVEAFEFLVDQAGLDPDAVYKSASLLGRAAGHGRLEIVRFLLDRGAGLQGIPLVRAVQGGNIEIVRLLIEAGADVNQGRRGFPTPLAMSRTERHPEIEQLLVENGATELVGVGDPKARPR